MQPWEYREYGDGWIKFSSPAAGGATITDALTAIRDDLLQAEYDQHLGPLRLGPPGDSPSHLTAVDGVTRLALTPQLVEFYSFARWWRGSALLDNVLDPGSFHEHVVNPRLDLPSVLRDEFEYPQVLVDTHHTPLDPARCALFSLDTLNGSPYSRVYLVFDPPTASRADGHTLGEPEVWGFQREHFHSPDLRSYLTATASPE